MLSHSGPSLFFAIVLKASSNHDAQTDGRVWMPTAWMLTSLSLSGVWMLMSLSLSVCMSAGEVRLGRGRGVAPRTLRITGGTRI